MSEPTLEERVASLEALCASLSHRLGKLEGPSDGSVALPRARPAGPLAAPMEVTPRADAKRFAPPADPLMYPHLQKAAPAPVTPPPTNTKKG